MKVLVTGAGALLGQGIIKCLRMAATPYTIVAADPDPRSAGLYWADKAYLIPWAADRTYLSRIEEIIRAERPEVILIGTDVELSTFANHRAALESRYQLHIIVSPSEVIRIADDKWLTFQFLKANGFPFPHSVLPGNEAELLDQCGFPLVVKPRVGARSVGVHLVQNLKELRQALADVVNPIIQQAIATANDEYTSGIILTGGRAQAIVTMRRDLRDGNTYRAYVQPDSHHNNLLCRIAEKLSGHGPINFQYRLDQEQPNVFEINARFSGTTPFRAVAGFNEVDAMVRHVVLGEPIPAPILRPVTILRYLEEMVIESDQIERLNDLGMTDSPRFERQLWP